MFARALVLDRKQGDTEGIVLRLNNLGNVRFFQARYADALRRYQEALAAREQALLLQNLGAFYRHMGDPVKAIDSYRRAMELFRVERDSDGELGSLKNTGIALALDLGDYADALLAFNKVIELARRTGNGRELMQARLLESSVATIETMRTGLRLTSLRSRFFVDKRDVYDALIARQLALPAGSAGPSPAALLRSVERARARTFQDQMQRFARFRGEKTPAGKGSTPPYPVSELEQIQARLDPSTALLVYWAGRRSAAVVWITADRAGVERLPWGPRLERQVMSYATTLGNSPVTE